MRSKGAQGRTPGEQPPDRGHAATERVRARQLARLGALFAGFAHEIRNPLSTIGLNLQLVKEDFGVAEDSNDERILRRITVVEGEVRRLQSILEQFLAYVRVPELEMRSVQLEEMLQDIVEFMQPEMAEKGVSIRFMTDGSVGAVMLDSTQLRAVIVNLVRNAMDACDEGDQILVATRRSERDVLVQVMDTGAGMSAAVRADAFTPYFSTKKTGTGLGLPTARRVVEQHGGALELESEPGKGTQFTIRLPQENVESSEGDVD